MKKTQWDMLPSRETIEKTKKALEKNGFLVRIAETSEQAKEEVRKLLPDHAEVITMTSITLETLGLTAEINESGKYDAVKPKLMKMNRETQSSEMQKLGAAPDYAIGSVHAVTMDGKVVVASNSGSQLSAYVYGSPHVIWIVGAQKIVQNMEEGLERIYEHSLPLESKRAHEAYGVPGSFVSKLIIFNKEPHPNRIQIILVNESLGY